MRKRTHPDLIHSIIDPLVAAAVEEKPKTSLETDAHYTKRLQEQLKHSFKQFQSRLQSAVKFLTKHGKWPQDARHRKAWEVLNDHEKWNRELNQGKTLQELLHFSDEELQDFYSEAWELHQHSRYEDASHIFLLLTQLNPKVGAFWFALAVSEEMRGELPDALNAYLLAAELEFHTLDPYVQAARCLLISNRKEDARKVLSVAVERADVEADLKIFKKQVEDMLNSIS